MLKMFVWSLSLYNIRNRGVFLLCKITNLLIYRTYLIFRTADKKTYEIVEGLVTGIDGKNPFARLRKIQVSDPAGRQSELLLDKNVKVLEGKRYRFYFGINEKKLVGIRRVDAALNNGTFLGNEEI